MKKKIKLGELRAHMAHHKTRLVSYIEWYLSAIVGPREYHTSLVDCGYLPGRAALQSINCVGFYRSPRHGAIRVVDANDGMHQIREMCLEDLWALARLLKKVRGRPSVGPRPDIYAKEKSPRFDYWRARALAGFRPNKRYRMEGLAGRAAWLGVTISEVRVLDEVFADNLQRFHPPC